MGVTSLWTVLESVGESHSLSNDAGIRVAVDLGSWIVPGMKVARQTNFANEIYMTIRAVFFRTIHLLRLGLKPVFVLDGQAPAVKNVTLGRRKTAAGGSASSSDRNRNRYREVANKCSELFRALGLPYIESPGEAEKLCACLNSNQLVDACLCDDSDIFLYGAQTVYRNFNFKQNDTTVTRYKMADIKQKLKLDRRSLVVFALLSGSDYGDGLRGVGVKKTQELIESIQCDDVLQRILSWKENTELQQIAKQLELLQKTSKPTHCSQCIHLGSLSQHKAKGCRVCGKNKNCTSSSSVACPCSWHEVRTTVQPHLLELSVREKALKMKDFPPKEVVDEFLDDIVPKVKLDWTMPQSLTHIKSILKTFLKWDPAEVNRKLLPVLVHMQLHGIVGKLRFEPIRIEKSCKKHFKPCYKTWWKANETKNGEENSFEVVVEEELFTTKYCRMTQEYLETLHAQRTPSSSGKKRKLKVDDSQPTIASVFKKAKRK
ncbi:flap endonuclease GEN homolog 1-like isoform X2 [Gigantopelta aegis]|uniref:flap endonuclease GEN homolog 1-like isoform X2 n=1 Tax=Gigantopelta aegis TaxID=1735272 RepID=UPI001B888564|nr:flap endonuclease GEN homolog 1-like isoform X2 [Gigantopelta aegis]